jgi:DivIVA domain-containing protein
MTLTPEDVRKKEFSTVRLREGYEMDEVDAFLDEVEAELTRLLRENEDLRARLAAASSRPPAVEGERAAEAPAAPAAPPAAPAVPAAVPAAAAAVAAPAVASPTDQAVRMLELAQRTADEHVAQAKAEADKLVAAARTEAQRVTADMQREQSALQGRIDQLKAFEREYRTRLRSYLEGQLRELESHGSAEPPIPPAMASAAAPTSAPGHAAAPTAAPVTPPAAPPVPPPATQGGPGVGPAQQPPRPATPFAPPTAPPVQAPSGD